MSVQHQFGFGLAGLTLLAAGLWTVDTTWTANWIDAVPALAGLPLVWWLGRPWSLRNVGESHEKSAVGTSIDTVTLSASVARELLTWPLALSGGVLLMAGAVSQTLILSAVGWTCLLACLLCNYVEVDKSRPWARLLPLAVLGFPWLAFQSPGLGWWFRSTGAIAAEWTLTILQLDVSREGTRLWTGGACVSVGEACSGLNGLQAMLVAGSVLAITSLPHSRKYWLHLPLLFAAAWTANALRVVFTAIGAHFLPLHWIEGESHLWQGWLLLCLMFVACQFLFQRVFQTMNVDSSVQTTEVETC